MNGYIAAWNLSASPNPNLVSLQPLVPATNDLKVRCKFSKPTLMPLTMIVWTQIATELKIFKDKNVSLSYYNVFNVT
jgi:hypothetical protein